MHEVFDLGFLLDDIQRHLTGAHGVGDTPFPQSAEQQVCQHFFVTVDVEGTKGIIHQICMYCYLPRIVMSS